MEEWIREKAQAQEKITEILGKKGKYLLVIIICVGLLAMIWPVTRADTGESPDLPHTAAGVNPAANTTLSGIKQELTLEMESVLTQIHGAGQVNVSLTLSSDGVKSYAGNSRTEHRESIENSAQGEKSVIEETVIQDLAVSSNGALVLEEKMPEILGVLVVADGAGDPGVKEDLAIASATLLDIPVYKVCVMPRKGGG